MFARPGLPRFDYVRATSPEEAVRLLEEYGGEARLLMGGTDLLPGLRDDLFQPQLVIDVKPIPSLRQIVFDPDEGLLVGAAVTMNEIERHPDIREHYPLLSQAAGAVASYQIRNRATIGGNLCNASPCADTAPAVLVLEGELDLYGPEGTRRVPASAFFVGPGRTALQPTELLTAIRFPGPRARTAARYLKLGRCKSGDLSLVGVAVEGQANGPADGYSFRIGLGSVAPVPLRALEAEAILAAAEPGEEAFVRAADQAKAVANPITDVRGTAGYQQAMVRTLTLRALRDVWNQLRSGSRG
ncbi:MAG: xanthine dehydrogenase family protein subunit M [Anaerolineae bacterium]|jgi:carbon-monoxide dehydrogenase medium subunit